MMNYTGWEIPEGKVVKVEDADGRVIWMLQSSGKPVILEVEKITSDTYAGETTYKGEQFILLDIYPKTNGTVKVTYGGLTKTITDTSGAEEPNAQKVFFGTFNGVTDEVETPASGTLTIEGDFYAFGCSSFQKGSKTISIGYSSCVTAVNSFGTVTDIPAHAFYSCSKLTEIDLPDNLISVGDYACSGASIEYVEIPSTVISIGNAAFANVKTANMLPTTPPELIINTTANIYVNFGNVTVDSCALERITVPAGCGNTYKTAEGWSTYADYIVEAS